MPRLPRVAAALFIAALSSVAVGQPPRAAQPTAPDEQARVSEAVLSRIDSAFAEWASPTSPGCVVSAESSGRALLTRAYGMADLEHGVPVTPNTVFEAGSISKQFAAAVILLLVEEGRLSLTDDVRRYVPELPDYGATITLDHLLTHTSGLRDWGTVMWLAGWPRGSRIYGNAAALDVMARQPRLNQPPGTYFSYTNSGFTLLPVIVERVTGRSLAEVARERLFEPLAMHRTQWREDFRRIVPDRAIAYRRSGSEYLQDMPFEHTYGHGGLLTTTGDLLTWNRAIEDRRLGDFVSAGLQRRAVLADGRATPYGRGLWIDTYRGTRQVHHGGATAGYRAWLARYPDIGLSIALLCNGPADDVGLGHRVADQLLPVPAARADDGDSSRGPAVRLTPRQAAARAGVFASEQTGLTLTIVADGDRLRISGQPARALSLDRHRIDWGEFLFEGADRVHLHELSGERFESYRRLSGPVPDAAELAALGGHYRSAETLASYTAAIEAGQLVLRVDGRPQYLFRFTPVGPDALTSGGDVMRIHRDASGRPHALTLSTVRARDVRLERVR